MFNSYGGTQMCPNDRNWPQMGLNQCKWAQVTLVGARPLRGWHTPSPQSTYLSTVKSNS